jgi:Protein of unknown function (DUF1501)
MKLSIIDNFPLFSPAKQGIIVPMLDGIKSAAPAIAGGGVRGVRGGQVVGRSDAQGGVPADNPVHVSDFVATIYHALG